MFAVRIFHVMAYHHTNLALKYGMTELELKGKKSVVRAFGQGYTE